MEQNIKKTLLRSIGKVYEESRRSKLELPFFKCVDGELKILSDYFNVTRTQSLIIAMVFALNYKDSTVDLKDLIDYFGCNPMKLLEYSDDFETLHTKGILKKRKSTSRVRVKLSNDQYSVNEQITKAILNSQPMPVIEKEDFKDVVELLREIFRLNEQRANEEIMTEELFEQTNDLLLSNQHFPLIERIYNLQLTIEDTTFYLYLLWKTINGNEGTNIGSATEAMFDNPSERVNYVQKVLFDKNDLTDRNLIEIVEADFFNDTEIIISDTTVKMLREFGLKLYANKRKPDNIIEPENIQAKTLIFNEVERMQLDMLQTLLEENNYRETQTRLQNKGLPKGITVLLHGLPGTGKTETVYQVAKETNREIVKVDISKSKSMWFGESEKIIKRIFNDYRSHAKNCERMPILLFNEADAIISKRKENGNSNVSQTENAIQNIILDELETFEGIFFATTNLAKNLDSAFERRFLFKIEFQKPNVLVKARIWSIKLPQLTDMECETLAGLYDFAGGQIDNIVRKNEIQEIIHGISVDFNHILGFCETELLLKNNRVKIGFKRA